MDRVRFDQLLEAYGADFARWPAAERAGGAAFAEAHAAAVGAALAEARALDEMLGAPDEAPDVALLSARILKQVPRAVQGFSARASWALAACALLGVVLGYGGGQLAAPAADQDDMFFTMAFEAPFETPGEGG